MQHRGLFSYQILNSESRIAGDERGLHGEHLFETGVPLVASRNGGDTTHRLARFRDLGLSGWIIKLVHPRVLLDLGEGDAVIGVDLEHAVEEVHGLGTDGGGEGREVPVDVGQFVRLHDLLDVLASEDLRASQ